MVATLPLAYFLDCDVLPVQGKTSQVTVVDRCPGCGVNDIDLSPAAFSDLANEGLGRISVSWALD